MIRKFLKWLYALGMRGWTYTYDTTTPIGDSTDHPPSQGDDRIREIKEAIQERENKDHYWPLTGTAVSHADVGKHRQCSFLEQADLGTGAEGKPILGAQTASGKAELVYTDEDDNDVQITSGGAINGGTEFITGDLIVSTVATAHTGWTNVSATYSNKFMRINATPLTTGGADTHIHTIAHTHAIDPPATAGYWTANPGGGYKGYSDGNEWVITTNIASFTSGAVSAANTGSGDNVPAYLQVVLFQKD